MRRHASLNLRIDCYPERPKTDFFNGIAPKENSPCFVSLPQRGRRICRVKVPMVPQGLDPAAQLRDLTTSLRAS